MSARPEEYAEIHVNGTILRNWETVTVYMEWGGTFWREFTFTVSEADPIASDFVNLRIKPGDAVQVLLAGQPAVDGYVYLRQVALDKQRHGVMIKGRSITGVLDESSVIAKTGQFRGYNFNQIMQRVTKDVGVTAIMRGDPGKPFKDVQLTPGETISAFLNRLARSRSIFLSDDETGKLIAENQSTDKSTDSLVEGVNIESARCTIRDDFMVSRMVALGQAQGSDEEYGRAVNQFAAEMKYPAHPRPSTHVFMAPRPTTQEDLFKNIQFEMAWREQTKIEAEITTPGWLRSNGSLWKPNEVVNVKSPSLLLNQDLKIRSITFNQDNASGTTTTLVCVPPLFMPGFVNVGGADLSKPNQTPDQQPTAPTVPAP